ncbi:hypothetical protein HMI54_010032 [Coelomomyces lativittatus]|nr:hypothetical protein HMI54_010032 [Coelomomyces lativittatus]
MAFGTRTHSSFETVFKKPNLRHLNSSWQLVSLQQHNSHSYASHEVLARTIAIKYLWPSRWGQHTLSYDLSWREIFKVANAASLLIRQDAGHSLKSSLLHSFVRDTRDHTTLPSRGYLCQVETEWAGLGGNVNHLKNQVVLQANLPLLKTGHSLSSTIKMGHILPLDSSFPRINDRLFLGGPTSVRGFKSNSLGPRDKDDALGGTIGYHTKTLLL